MKTYHIFRAPDGCGNNYLGSSRTLRGARRMAAQHARGEIGELAEWLWETARKAGQCDGICAPPPVGEPVAWFGRGGWYCACVEE